MQPNLEFIRHRAELLKLLREFFDSRGFLEVQPPCLASDCVVDAYLDPVAVQSTQLRLGTVHLPGQMLLQTSAESAMKRMLAAGAPSIYSIGPVFRSGEHGRLHNIEFTMLEWYEVGGNLTSGVQMLGELTTQMLAHADFDVQTYRAVFRQTLQVDPIDAPLDCLRELCLPQDAELTAALGSDRNAILDVLMSTRIQPSLGWDQPVIITHYPIGQAALARQSQEDPDCCARFELFARGVELANGYDELTDPETFLQRAETNNSKRRADGRSELVVKSKLYHSMQREKLPPCAGVALGVDRLLMLRVGAGAIDQVIPISIERW